MLTSSSPLVLFFFPLEKRYDMGLTRRHEGAHKQHTLTQKHTFMPLRQIISDFFSLSLPFSCDLNKLVISDLHTLNQTEAGSSSFTDHLRVMMGLVNFTGRQNK